MTYHKEVTSPSKQSLQEGMWVIGYGSLIFKPPPHYAFKANGYLKGFIRRFWQSSSDHRGTPDAPGRVVTLLSLEDLQSNPKFHNDLHMYELSSEHPESDLLSPSASIEVKNLEIHNRSRRINELTKDDLKVWGCAYYILPEHVETVKHYLDVREQDGYSTHTVPFHIVNIPDELKIDKNILDTIPKDKKTGDYYIESVIYIGTVDNESFVGPESIERTGKTIKVSRGPSGENSEYLIELNKAVRSLDKIGNSRDYYLEDLVKIVES